MPVLIDVEKEQEVKERNLDNGVPLVLPAEAKSTVVMSKYIIDCEILFTMMVME